MPRRIPWPRYDEHLFPSARNLPKPKMITALLQTRLPQAVSREQALAMFRNTAPNYLNKPGLIRKYYLLSEDGHSVGGVYLWESRELAEQVYTDEWREYVKQTFGEYPSLVYFHTPLVVDNLSGEVID
jgi:hypothetical protein